MIARRGGVKMNREASRWVISASVDAGAALDNLRKIKPYTSWITDAMPIQETDFAQANPILFDLWLERSSMSLYLFGSSIEKLLKAIKVESVNVSTKNLRKSGHDLGKLWRSVKKASPKRAKMVEESYARVYKDIEGQITSMVFTEGKNKLNKIDRKHQEGKSFADMKDFESMCTALCEDIKTNEARYELAQAGTVFIFPHIEYMLEKFIPLVIEKVFSSPNETDLEAKDLLAAGSAWFGSIPFQKKYSLDDLLFLDVGDSMRQVQRHNIRYEASVQEGGAK